VRASVNHGTAQVPSRPTTCVVAQMPGAYAPALPMSLTRSLRSSNPPSAAKNGTCVVPACVTSGPWPETAALRIRSNWTSQPTSSTLTSMPVRRSKGATIRSVSLTGSGPLFMTHSRTVCPLSDAGVLFDDVLPPPLLLPPHAAATRHSAARATATRAIAGFLRISCSLLLPPARRRPLASSVPALTGRLRRRPVRPAQLSKTFTVVPSTVRAPPQADAPPQLDGGDGAAVVPRTMSSTGRIASSGASASPAMRASSSEAAAAPMPALS
jgi:hypothetical protein